MMGRGKIKSVKGIKYMLMGGDWASDAEHTIEYTEVPL